MLCTKPPAVLSRRSVAAALLLAGCSRAHKAGRGGSGSGEPDDAVLRYPLQIEPTSFDPPLITEIYSSELMGNVYECLCRIGEDNTPQPALAESWDISADGRTYTFHLRRDVTFHNGRSMTAKDVIFSFERALRRETRSPVALAYFQGILGAKELAGGKSDSLNGVRALDDHRLEIRLDKPRPYILGMLSYNTAAVVCREACEGKNGRLDHTNAVGTGPYRLVDYTPRRRAVLEAFEGYWGGKAYVPRIERAIILDQNTAHLQFEEGRLDFTIITHADYVRDRASARLQKAARILKRAQTTYLAFQQDRQPVFRDPRVRQAFAHAVPRADIHRVAFQGIPEPAGGFLPKGMLGCDPKYTGLSFDPGRARQLLEGAGFPGGRGLPSLTLEFLDKEPQWGPAAQIIRDALKSHLGITIDLRQREAGSYFTDTHENRVPFFLAGWTADYVDPQNFVSTLFHSKSKINRFGYRNPTFDTLCGKGDTSMVTTEREAAYRDADRILTEDAGCVPLVHNVRCALVGTHVSGFRDNLLNHLPMNRVRLGRR
jgi:ABC-type transport system substrate-binding protein